MMLEMSVRERSWYDYQVRLIEQKSLREQSKKEKKEKGFDEL